MPWPADVGERLGRGAEAKLAAIAVALAVGGGGGLGMCGASGVAACCVGYFDENQNQLLLRYLTRFADVLYICTPCALGQRTGVGPILEV